MLRLPAASLLLLHLLAGLASAEQIDWTTLTSRVTWSDRDEWVKIEGAVLHHQQVFARMPADVRLAPFRRRLLKAVTHVPVRYADKKSPCLCDRVENDPTLFISPAMIGHYGHTMFDGVTGAYAAITEAHMQMGNLTFYMDFQHGPAKDEILASTDDQGRLNLGKWKDIFGMMSTRPVYNLAHLLEQSSHQVICFDQLHLPKEEELDSDCTYRITVLDRQGARQILNAAELSDALQQALHDEGLEHSCVRWMAQAAYKPPRRAAFCPPPKAHQADQSDQQSSKPTGNPSRFFADSSTQQPPRPQGWALRPQGTTSQSAKPLCNAAAQPGASGATTVKRGFAAATPRSGPIKPRSGQANLLRASLQKPPTKAPAQQLNSSTANFRATADANAVQKPSLPGTGASAPAASGSLQQHQAQQDLAHTPGRCCWDAISHGGPNTISGDRLPPEYCSSTPHHLTLCWDSRQRSSSVGARDASEPSRGTPL
ncbi:hypothetical protein WJX73_010708 [Symbiochloris irregularis]|uniref:Uncharacterized protein n=1 Tax=Symbiochloris irregularis TaxID=706552 RepID=A0AAW1NW71_9CHLO